MEIVLGIDNIVFISILTGKLPEAEQARGRSLGLMLALVTRLGLLFAISWIMRLTTPLFSAFGQPISGRDLNPAGWGTLPGGQGRLRDPRQTGRCRARSKSGRRPRGVRNRPGSDRAARHRVSLWIR